MIGIAFLLCFLGFFLQIAGIFPSALFPFIPFLSVLLLHPLKSRSLPKILYLSTLLGISLDLLSDHPPGFYALTYCLLPLLAFPIRHWFSVESPLHLGVLSACFSFLCTLLQRFFLFLFDRSPPFSGQWALTDWAFTPFFDGIYATFWVAFPLLTIQKGYHLWTQKKKSRRSSRI